MRARSLAALAAFCIAAGCDSSGVYDVAGANGTPVMQPGQDCMKCHTAGGAAAGHQFTVAGTVFPTTQSSPDAGVQDVEVLIVDSVGTKLTLLTNEAGNFYTSEVLKAPVRIDIQQGNHRMRMVEAPPSPDGGLGTPISCNLCHTSPTPAVAPVKNFSPAPGRIFIPTEAPASK